MSPSIWVSLVKPPRSLECTRLSPQLGRAGGATVPPHAGRPPAFPAVRPQAVDREPSNARFANEAQLVVQSALGARGGVRRPPQAAGDEWYLRSAKRAARGCASMPAPDGWADPAPRRAARGLDIAVAKEIGTAYGRLLRGEGLTLSQALRGYLYFSDFLLDAVLRMAETAAGSAALDWSDMLREVHAFTRQILVSMIAVYDS